MTTLTSVHFTIDSRHHQCLLVLSDNGSKIPTEVRIVMGVKWNLLYELKRILLHFVEGNMCAKEFISF